MEKFASGVKRNYYGKGDVTVYRLDRDGRAPGGRHPVFGANVLLLIYGDAFWPTYTAGDNTNLIATDSMKNFIQRETMNFPGSDLESYCLFIAEKFMNTYAQTEGAQVTATEIPYAGLGGVAYAPAGPERAYARTEIARDGKALRPVETVAGIRGFRLLRLNGSAFKGFVRDQYTTLPDIANRPLHMWLDLEWSYSGAPGTDQVRGMVRKVFAEFESGSIQELIYQLGSRMLAEIPSIREIHLEANNRTWDTVAEQEDRTGVYTDPRPPYGCLGLTMRR